MSGWYSLPMSTTDRMTVLASGSSGNATLVEAGGFGVLLDCGLGPRELTARMQAVGASWQAVKAVVLTHTHTDHWNRYTLEHLRRLSIPLIAHPEHHQALAAVPQYDPLARAGLVRDHLPFVPLQLGPELTLRTVPVPHDSDPTFALLLDAGDLRSPAWSVGLASDLGRVPDEAFDLLAGVDVLAIEFNHDEVMERASRRPQFLIDRVLGDFGHLSNRQAAEAVAALAGADEPGGLAAVIQLHLSRDCNTPELAATAGRAALRQVRSNAVLITAGQFQPSPSVPLTRRSGVRRSVKVSRRGRRSVQLSLPGMDAVAE
jgi:phosphoribosyl 1,2-cyclic phosphodiesterase